MTLPFIFIDVRNARAYVSRKRGSDSSWTHEPCVNWQALEALAGRAVEDAGGSITLSGIYPCPDELSALALWREDVFALVLTPVQAGREFGVTRAAIHNAVSRETVPYFRPDERTVLLLRQDVEERWGGR